MQEIFRDIKKIMVVSGGLKLEMSKINENVENVGFFYHFITENNDTLLSCH